MTEEQREDVPPYLAMAAALQARIEPGELPPGAILPSITRISQEWGVAKATDCAFSGVPPDWPARWG